MSTPKSVTKVSKDGRVTYTSNVDQVQYFIFELSRAALRDVGKYVKKVWKTAYYSHFKRRSGHGGQAIQSQVLSGKNTKYPRVQIGLPHSHKGKEVEGFYAFFQEFGAKDGSIPRLGLLTHAAQDNVAEIVKIESQYLSGLSGEAARLEAMIDEDDMEGDADEN